MAITRNDCLLLLSELQASGVECDSMFKRAMNDTTPSVDVVKFIHEQRPLEAIAFYEKLRKSYNDKKSKLYINIVKDDLNPKDVLSTLASLNLQIILFTKNVKNTPQFLSHVRYSEITKCLYNYALTYDYVPCQRLLQLIKADLKVLEYINGRSVDIS